MSIKDFYLTIKAMFNQKGLSTTDVATGMSMAVIVTSIAVVTGSAILLDTEERGHIFNAATIVDALEAKIVNGDFFSPGLNETSEFTLQELYNAGIVDTVIDVSNTEGQTAYYHPTASIVQIKNIVRVDGSDKNVEKFFIKLVRDDASYVYVDETEASNPSPIEVKNLTRDNVAIPKRDDTGK